MPTNDPKQKNQQQNKPTQPQHQNTDMILEVPQATASTNPSASAQKLHVLEEQEDLKKKKVTIQSAQDKALLEAYKKKFGDDEWYKKNPPKENKDGTIALSFKSTEDMATFFKEQAKENKSFIVYDANTKKVLAYSNGDGKLYHGNGELYEKGEFRPGESQDKFKMPARDAEPTSQQKTL